MNKKILKNRVDIKKLSRQNTNIYQTILTKAVEYSINPNNLAEKL